MDRNGFFFLLAGILALVRPAPSSAQPTYKLGVGTHLQPWATLKIDGDKLARSTVKDDPGFRLQYAIQRDGKPLEPIEARADMTVDLPRKDAGTYIAVLELFHPSYKPGNAQKGQFKAISNVLAYKVVAGEKVQVLEPVPALVIQCGKGKGKSEEEKIATGFGFKLLQGSASDDWPNPAPKSHCWIDPKMVRFEITLPATSTGLLRLHFLDGDLRQRKQKVSVLGRDLDLEGFGAPGKTVEVPLTPGDAKAGKVEVVVQNLNPAASAVLSTVELLAFPLGK